MQTLTRAAAEPRQRQVRAFTAADAPAVACLYERVLRSGRQPAPEPLVDYFRTVFCEAPTADPEIPSLVYEDSGRIAGFLGVYARQLRFAGRPIRMAASGQLVTSPEVRGQGAGILLMQRFLQGCQDLAITDGATPEVQRIWERLGGQTAWLHCLRWTLLLRPAGFASRYGQRRPWLRPWLRAASPLASLADAIARHLRHRRRTPAIVGHGQPLTAEVMVEHWQRSAGNRRLQPDYSLETHRWLLEQMASVRSRGRFVARTVGDAGAPARGWYVYYLTRERIAEVVQVVAAEGAAEQVLEQLIRDADGRGALAVEGRLEGPLVEPLNRLRCWLHYRAPLALIHARQPELLAAVQSGQSSLTRADGEWWVGFLTERFDAYRAS